LGVLDCKIHTLTLKGRKCPYNNVIMDTSNRNDKAYSNLQETDIKMLEKLQAQTFNYFLKYFNPTNGLIADKSDPDSHSSIAAVGLGITSYVVAIQRNLISKEEAVKRILNVLNFFNNGHQGPESDAMGYKGFYYHFLDMNKGSRAWESELSTIDTAIFMAGVLTAANYFTGDNKEEKEIRKLTESLYRRIDWRWALNGRTMICHGWKPESGFLDYYWDQGYSEAIILYILAMGSPTHAIDPVGYLNWTSTFEWNNIDGIEYIQAGPLFIHQMSHLWLDFQGIRDDLNRKYKIDYFENSRRATYIQQQYAIKNPLNFKYYGENNWGFTASDGPGPAIIMIDGTEKIFYDYVARGVPFGPDDGTISPWAVVASLPFAPEIVLSTIRHAIQKLKEKNAENDGFDASFNTVYKKEGMVENGWVSPWKFGLNEGPMVIMIENFQTQLIWNIIKKCVYITDGLRRAGFKGGWLD
jgi:hypothetical protein